MSDNKITVIASADYVKNYEALAQDPVIIAMAKGLEGVPRSELVHDNDGGPRFEFMQAANAEYRKRNGQTTPESIGAVAHALLKVLDK